jgi:hypothetical protein
VAAAAERPRKPSAPATTAMTRNMKAQVSMARS